MKLRGAGDASHRRRSSPTSTTTPRASATQIALRQRRATTLRVRPADLPPDASEDHAARRPERPASQLFTDPAIVQDLRYTYDPAGNITRIEDARCRRSLHATRASSRSADYTYDAIYRLIEATGREHIGQTAFDFNPPDGDYRDYPFVGLALIRTTCRRCATTPSATNTTRSATSELIRHVAIRRRLDAHATTYQRAQPARSRQEEQPADAAPPSATASTNRALHPRRPRQHDLDAAPARRWTGTSRTSCSSRSTSAAAARPTTSTSRRPARAEGDRDGRTARARRSGSISVASRSTRVQRHGARSRSSARRCTSWTTSSDRAGRDPDHGSARSVSRPVLSATSSATTSAPRAWSSTRRRADLVRGVPPVRQTSFQAGSSAAEVSLKRYRYTGKERDEERGCTTTEHGITRRGWDVGRLRSRRDGGWNKFVLLCSE